jgi:predicted O-methyltransferase YrrM
MYKEARERLTPFNCHVIRAYSMDAVRWFDDESLDFVYIDANHAYEPFCEDLEAWDKKVRKGGIVSGHDWINGCNGLAFGVKQRFWEWLEDNPQKKLFILNKRGSPSWMYVKE